MILPDFVLNSRINLNCVTSGIDTYEHCLDQQHFKNWKIPIEYQFNSRGFRDSEWPDDLSSAIWCFGDSFTVGLGSPLTHTWPRLLETQTGKRCINISMDGASNDWIARKARKVIDTINPAQIVIQWSFLSRAESTDTTLSDEQRRLRCHPLLDWSDNEKSLYASNFTRCMNMVNRTGVVHTAIPDYKVFQKQLEFDVYEVNRIDLARDGFHYGINSASLCVEHIRQIWHGN